MLEGKPYRLTSTGLRTARPRSLEEWIVHFRTGQNPSAMLSANRIPIDKPESFRGVTKECEWVASCSGVSPLLLGAKRRRAKTRQRNWLPICPFHRAVDAGGVVTGKQQLIVGRPWSPNNEKSSPVKHERISSNVGFLCCGFIATTGRLTAS